MTYRELYWSIKTMTDDQLDLDVTYCNQENELFRCEDVVHTSDLDLTDVLGPPNHPVII